MFFKAETLQHGGAFKLRGAYNRLVQLDASQRRAGVVAFSSGNHAQGVALAARMLGVPAVIVMPADAPSVKLAGTRALGAEVRLYDRVSEDRETIAAAIANERGMLIVPSFDDPDIIAGQGTVGLEIVNQIDAAGAAPGFVVGPIGGGGLMAGVCLALAACAPRCRLVGVEPEGFDDARRSLAAGRRVSAPPRPRSLCDALESPMTGQLTFPVLQAHLSAVATVSDAEVAAAMRAAFSRLKLVVEPGGAASLAALLAGKIPLGGVAAVAILSGGNVDAALFAEVLAERL